MKKYKLIKEFSNSPKLNTIVEKSNANSHYYAPIVHGINPTWVEDYPEFWEEIKEPTYEVLTLRSNYGTLASYDKGEKGCYSNPLNKAYSTREYWVKCFLEAKPTNWSIYCIRRLSDGEIFSIGDKVVRRKDEYCSTPNTTVRTIDKFTIGSKDEVQFNENYLLELFNKDEEPLFVTEDGQPIYKDDKYWYVVEDNKNIIHYAWKTLYHHADWDYNPECQKPPLGKVQFSTKELAQEYILLNKPMFSVNEIKEKLLDSYLYGGHSMYAELDELAKSKLNG